jgi:hypothetical protein
MYNIGIVVVPKEKNGDNVTFIKNKSSKGLSENMLHYVIKTNMKKIAEIIPGFVCLLIFGEYDIESTKNKIVIHLNKAFNISCNKTWYEEEGYFDVDTKYASDETKYASDGTILCDELNGTYNYFKNNKKKWCYNEIMSNEFVIEKIYDFIKKLEKMTKKFAYQMNFCVNYIDDDHNINKHDKNINYSDLFDDFGLYNSSELLDTFEFYKFKKDLNNYEKNTLRITIGLPKNFKNACYCIDVVNNLPNMLKSFDLFNDILVNINYLPSSLTSICVNKYNRHLKSKKITKYCNFPQKINNIKIAAILQSHGHFIENKNINKRFIFDGVEGRGGKYSTKFCNYQIYFYSSDAALDYYYPW